MPPPTSAVINIAPALGRIDPQLVASGPLIPPTDRVALFSPSQWEAFTNEWAASLTDKYEKVERTSGAGDHGCDVVGFPNVGDDTWDNFQCKHYDHPLMPSEASVEIAKLCYYTSLGTYTLPRAYRFVAPKNVGTSLGNLLRKPESLRQYLYKNWTTQCQNKIVTTHPVPLSASLKAHIDSIDFSIFGYIPLLTILEEHRKTPYYVARFGLGLPERPAAQLPPAELAQHETRYVEQLFEAYGDNVGSVVSEYSNLAPTHQRHFDRARESFYAAESLRNFSRDTLPEGTFEHLMEEVFEGVVDVCEAAHSCDFTRLLETTKQAITLTVTNSPLMGKTGRSDLRGICHQLANGDRLTWVP